MPSKDFEDAVGDGNVDDLLEGANPEGIETEEDLGSIDPSLLGKAVVTGTDWTADTILSQLTKGNIVLEPTFQRRDAWTQSRKSKL